MRVNIKLTGAAATALLAAPAVAGIGPNVKVADSWEDYSSVQGHNGWSYGYYDGDGAQPFSPDDFEEMSVFEPTESRWWVNNGAANPLTLIDANLMHTGYLDGAQQWAVRRWTSNTASDVAISVDMRRLQDDLGGDGVRLFVFVDGVERQSIEIGAQETDLISFEMFETLSVGSVIDFALDPIGQNYFDAVEFGAIVMTVPSPSSLALLGLGVLAVGRRRR
jgi:uncharacterized protein (TIGR03382 family)